MSRGRHSRPSMTARVFAAGTTAASGIAVTGAIAASAHTGTVPVVLAAYQSPPGMYSVTRDVTQKAVTRWYTVASGDYLSGIAARKCDNPSDWTGIYQKNQKEIGSNPGLIYQGQKLALDCVTAAQPTPPPVQPSPPPVTPPPAGFDPSGQLTAAQVGELWVNAGGPAWAEGEAEETADCESGDNTDAYNPSGASGLFQILGQVTDFGGSLFDADVNAANAVAKFEASGDSWAQWVCKP